MAVILSLLIMVGLLIAAMCCVGIIGDVLSFNAETVDDLLRFTFGVVVICVVIAIFSSFFVIGTASGIGYLVGMTVIIGGGIATHHFIKFKAKQQEDQEDQIQKQQALDLELRNVQVRQHTEIESIWHGIE